MLGSKHCLALVLFIAGLSRDDCIPRHGFTHDLGAEDSYTAPPVLLSPHNFMGYLTPPSECLSGIPRLTWQKQNFPLSSTSVSSPVFPSSRNGTPLQPGHPSYHPWFFLPPPRNLPANQPPTVSPAPQASRRSINDRQETNRASYTHILSNLPCGPPTKASMGVSTAR